MKKLLLLLGLSVITTPALAQDGERYLSPSPTTGLYAGIQGGYSWTDSDSSAADFDVDGGEYGVFVGFQADRLLDSSINRLGLGLNGAIEAYYTDSRAEDSVGALDLEKDYDWGINFRPGLTILDRYSPFGAKPYGIIGYRRATFDATVPGASGEEDFDGFELGLGTELLAYEKFGVRLDYTHVFYEDKGGFDPDENNVRLGVAYHF